MSQPFRLKAICRLKACDNLSPGHRPGSEAHAVLVIVRNAPGLRATRFSSSPQPGAPNELHLCGGLYEERCWNAWKSRGR